jgi:hypothetical protein
MSAVEQGSPAAGFEQKRLNPAEAHQRGGGP